MKITRKKGEPWISVPPVAKQPEPATLKALKEEISRRWSVIDLLNLLKDVDHVTGFTGGFSSVASRSTNVGIKRVADGVAAVGGQDADSEMALRRTRRLFIDRDNLRAAIRTIVNKTLEAREVDLWGPGTLCASDSRKFGSWSANFMTEWHQRYGGPGIMVCWHVERRSLCIYSQVTSTTASEVASMIEGLLRHPDQRGDRLPVHRYAWGFDRWFHVRALAGLPTAASVEEHRVREAVPAGGRGGRGVAAP